MQTTQLMPMRTMYMRMVLVIAFFKDNRRIVTASEDKTLRIWDVEKRALEGGTFEKRTDGVKSVAVSPNDR
ncbi:hypothetical protein BDR04DRAFT_1063066 [Suillus decipiens]|nr:hypothetical protein BDR04DRAFT_1063066 [Suillus decipiens]